MSLAAQALVAVDLARERHPADQAIQDAADQVEAALGPTNWRQTTWGEGGLSACVGYSDANASAWQRTVAWALAACDEWDEKLRQALATLRAALAAIGDAPAVEVVDAVVDAAENQEREREQLPGRPADWWTALPGPVKLGIGVAAVWLVVDTWSKVK